MRKPGTGFNLRLPNFRHRRSMRRRRFLELLAAPPLAALGGCALHAPRANAPHACHAADAPIIAGQCRLAPVHVAPEREIRTVVGLRPYRPSGFVVRVESLGDTRVVHNYGHGGGGITLSWGTAKLAVDLGAPGHAGPVAVIGCGAVGLATARLLQENGFATTIYAEHLPPDTTSNIAGGQWFPFLVADSGKRTAAFDQQFLAACAYAHRRYQLMVGPRLGVRWMRNYFARDSAFNERGALGKEGPLRALLPSLRDLARDEHPFAGYTHVRQVDTMMVEPSVYLPAMLDEFHVAGGRVVVGRIADRAAVQALPEKLVFNCTGLGAKALFDDAELVPVKGQLTILLPQPEVGYAAIHGDFYMFPRSDGIVLGGTHVEGDWSLEPDPAAKVDIFAGHKAFFDGFRNA